jgi:hypothetical protein
MAGLVRAPSPPLLSAVARRAKADAGERRERSSPRGGAACSCACGSPLPTLPRTRGREREAVLGGLALGRRMPGEGAPLLGKRRHPPPPATEPIHRGKKEGHRPHHASTQHARCGKVPLPPCDQDLSGFFGREKVPGTGQTWHAPAAWGCGGGWKSPAAVVYGGSWVVNRGSVLPGAFGGKWPSFSAIPSGGKLPPETEAEDRIHQGRGR